MGAGQERWIGGDLRRGGVSQLGWCSTEWAQIVVIQGQGRTLLCGECLEVC